MNIIFFVLFVEASVVIVCKFQRNRSTFEYEFEYEYECVANFMDIGGRYFEMEAKLLIKRQPYESAKKKKCISVGRYLLTEKMHTDSSRLEQSNRSILSLTAEQVWDAR